MQVLKFGGTSLGTPTRMAHVLKIIGDSKKKRLVVLSAMAGTTNKLKHIAHLIQEQKLDLAQYYSQQLHDEYLDTLYDLLSQENTIKRGLTILSEHFNRLKQLIFLPYSSKNEKIISGIGELLSTALFYLLCREQKVDAVLLSALDFMKITDMEAPDYPYIKEKLNDLLQQHTSESLLITQGYICRNSRSEIDNLGRGGSDYTATIIGAVLQAEEVAIWTDINGIHNNDPRYVDKTTSIAELSYEEASKLAHFGAKILHPSCLTPVKKYNIPVWIKNTFAPQAFGTLISQNPARAVEKVISVKEKETLLSVYSNDQLPLPNYLCSVFEIFKAHRIEIDMVSFAHHTVNLVFDAKDQLASIIAALKPIGEVHYEENQVIINIIGQFQKGSSKALGQVMDCLSHIPIKMVSQKQDICNYLLILIDAKYKLQTLKLLNEKVLENEQVFASMVPLAK